MSTYTKQLLSASNQGKQIGVTAVSPPGNTVHVASGVSGDIDEVYLYVTNNGTSTLPVVTCWGGTTISDFGTTYVPAYNGRVLISDGRIISNGSTISVYTGTLSGSFLVADGFVNRISLAPSVTIAQAWANRVVFNGGARPSTNTISALDVFYNGMVTAGLDTKVAMANALVPDSLTAALTPFIYFNSLSLWTNHNFLAADLTVNGLIGDGSSKYLETGFVPGAGRFPVLTTTSAGVIVYVSVDDFSTIQEELSVDGASTNSAFGLDTHYSGPGDFFGCWKNVSSGTDGLINWSSPTPPAGYYSGQRIASNNIAVYFANSSNSHASLATGSGAQTGSIETVQPMYAFAVNPNGGAASNFSKKRLSFLATTSGLTATDSTNLFNLVQALRTALGGGYV